MSNQQILDRYEKAKITAGPSNCRGTALYLAGLLSVDYPIDTIPAKNLEACNDLIEVPGISEGVLIAFFNGYVLPTDFSKFQRNSAGHLGICISRGDSWKVLHRDGQGGKMYEDSFVKDSALGVYLSCYSRPKIVFSNNVLDQLPNSGIGFFRINTLAEPSSLNLVNLLRKDGSLIGA